MSEDNKSVNKELSSEQLDDVSGGVMVPVPVLECKQCGKKIKPLIYSRNGGYCDSCKFSKIITPDEK